MSANRVSGLASAFEKPAPAKEQASAAGVSSIVSRFDSNSAQDEGNRLSKKVSDIANRFGSVVDNSKPSPLPAKKFVPKPKISPEKKVVEEKRQAVNDITKKFSRTDIEDKKESQFASAADAFRKREEADKKPPESRVSAFARQLDSGSKQGDDDATTKVAGTTRAFESAETTGGMASVLSRFESRDTAPNKGKGGEAPTEKQRFATATKLFENGKGPEKKEEAAEEGSAQQRFADAAKLFSGGS